MGVERRGALSRLIRNNQHAIKPKDTFDERARQ
jgi:hypothetical protein